MTEADIAYFNRLGVLKIDPAAVAQTRDWNRMSFTEKRLTQMAAKAAQERR